MTQPIGTEDQACPCRALGPFEEAALGRFATLPAGHVVRTLAAEHVRLVTMLDEIEAIVNRIQSAPSFSSIEKDVAQLRVLVQHLIEADRHHRREEHVLFARLGEHGVVAPQEVMAREHAALRAKESELWEALEDSGDLARFKRRIPVLSRAVTEKHREHIFKEDTVLYPYALRVIRDDAAWAQMRRECDEIGYCCFSPPDA